MKSTSDGTAKDLPVSLHILVTITDVYGPELHLESIIRELLELTRRGHEVTCIVATYPYSKRVPMEMSALDLSTIPLRRMTPVLSFVYTQFVTSWRVLRMMSQCDVLILNTYSALLSLPLLVFMRIRKASPVVVLRILSNPVEKQSFLANILFEFIYNLSIKLSSIFFDRLFFISPMLGEMYARKLHLDRKKNAVWPSPIDLDVFNPRAVTGTKQLREELGLGGSHGFLYHGALTKSRGIIEMVDAFRILQTKSVSASLVLLGYGKMRSEIAQYVKRNNMESYVKLRGPVAYSTVPDYIAACDAGIMALPDHPWWRYQCPTKVLECLAMDKPLIVSDIPAHRWLLDSMPAAFYMKGTNPTEIAAAVQLFLKSKRSHEKGQGRNIAKRFSVREIASRLENEMRVMVRERMLAS